MITVLPALFIFTDRTIGSRPAHKYGDALEALIKKEKLGVTKSSPVRLNRMNYTDHFDKVWTWAPSIEGLNRWIENDRATTKDAK